MGYASRTDQTGPRRRNDAEEADILDRRHCSAIKETAVDVSDDVLMLDLTSEYDISMEVWKLTTISSEIEDVFGLKLKIIRS